MPYIPQEKRDKLEPHLQKLGVELLNEPDGVWNYVITSLIGRWFAAFGERNLAKYEDYEKVIGLLESIKLEFYRRLMASYEDKKCLENGDVYQFRCGC